jgi:hypothetical protein
VRKLFTIRWIGFHVLTIGCVGLFSLLGKWQWDVGESQRGTLRNYMYGVEWWVFAVILLVLWWRLLRQELRGDARTDQTARKASRPKAPRYRAPAPQITAHVDDAEDPAMAAYNRYLNSLHQKDLATGGSRERG